MKTIVITGGNRGIGRGLVEHFLRHQNRVVATYRDANRSSGLLHLAQSQESLTVIQADVTIEQDRLSLFKELSGSFDSIDWLIHNAGVAVWGPLSAESEQRLIDTFRVNVVAPLLLTQTLLPLIRKSSDPRIWMISSKMGSLMAAPEMPGPNYAYPVSKAALNMAGVQLAKELREENIPVFLQTPGWVQTDMGGKEAVLSIEECVAALALQFERLGMEESGQFFEYDGSHLPY